MGTDERSGRVWVSVHADPRLILWAMSARSRMALLDERLYRGMLHELTHVLDPAVAEGRVRGVDPEHDIVRYYNALPEYRAYSADLARAVLAEARLDHEPVSFEQILRWMQAVFARDPGVEEWWRFALPSHRRRFLRDVAIALTQARAEDG